MRSRVWLLAVLVGCALAGACGGGTGAGPPHASPAEPIPTISLVAVPGQGDEPAEAAAPPPSAVATDEPSGDLEAGSDVDPGPDAIGIPECDAYFALLVQCASSMSPEGQNAMADALAATRQAWRAAAAGPHRDTLAETCVQVQASLEANPACRPGP